MFCGVEVGSDLWKGLNSELKAQNLFLVSVVFFVFVCLFSVFCLLFTLFVVVGQKPCGHPAIAHGGQLSAASAGEIK